MKKLFVLSVLFCASLVQALATEWTDNNGVTWTFRQQSYSYDDDGEGVSTRHTHYTITGAANYGDEVTARDSQSLAIIKN